MTAANEPGSAGGAPRRAVIGLGANLGELDATLDAACAAIAALPHSRWLGVSGRWCSRPVDSSGPDYLNAVAAIETRLVPRELLAALQAIENAHGRERPWRNAPRTLDLDVLLIDDLASDDPVLLLPHPRLLERAFVLLPLLELHAALGGALPLPLPGRADRAGLQALADRLAREQGLERRPD
ncbi:hypothetical protein MASR2M32_10370 [Sphaerotilus sulfidivorans]